MGWFFPGNRNPKGSECVEYSMKQMETITSLANSGRLADWEMAKALLVGAGMCEEQDAEEYLWNRVVVPRCSSRRLNRTHLPYRYRMGIEYERKYAGFFCSDIAIVSFYSLVTRYDVFYGERSISVYGMVLKKYDLPF